VGVAAPALYRRPVFFRLIALIRMPRGIRPGDWKRDYDGVYMCTKGTLRLRPKKLPTDH